MSTQPNVVVVITHDTGRHLGTYGRGVATPNLDRLASDGVVFERAFCAAPQCSPSRASLLTGLAPHRHGNVGLTHRGFRLHDDSYRRTLPALLGAAGYTTHLFGFQHEAPAPYVLGYQRVVQEPNARRHYCAEVAPMAAEFLASRPATPFFAMVGFFETHRPFDPTAGPLDDVQVPPYLPDDPIVRRDVADLDEQVRRADSAVGQILDALDRSGHSENTLFLYTTDHGIAFPGAKGTLFDPGVEVGLIARGPGGFANGRRIGALVSNVDVLPTILDLCGVAVPPETHGRSLLPLVHGEAERVRDEVYFELTYHTAYDPMRGIRSERCKYIRSYADRPLHFSPHVDPSPTKDLLRARGFFEARRPTEMLFDLVRDPLERENLADDAAYADVRQALRARLDQWMRDTDDPLLVGEVQAPVGAKLTPVDSYDP